MRVDYEAFRNDIQKHINAAKGSRGATLESIAREIDVSYQVLYCLSIATNIRLDTYVKCCEWMGCSLYKYIK